MDIESNLLEIPETDYSADIAMSSDDFGKLINQLSIFGKDILFELGDTIKVTGKGDDGKMSVLELTHTDRGEIAATCEKIIMTSHHRH